MSYGRNSWQASMALAIAFCLLCHPIPGQSQEVELPPGVSALPELTELVDAPFPELALEDGVQSDVLFRIVVAADGTVSELEPTEIIFYMVDENNELYEQSLEPEYDPYGFVEAARGAISLFLFEPAKNEAGEPISVELIWRYSFYFEEEATETAVTEVGPDEVVLRGEVLDRGSRLPLNGVIITVTGLEGEFTTETDIDGVFEFMGLPAGTWRVSAQPDSHEPIEADEIIVAGERTEVSYLVEAYIETEFSYEVRAEAVRREVSRQTISVSEIERIPGNNGDVIKVVQNLPGFARSPFNGGLVVIRGSSPEDSRIFVEGVWVPLIFHFGGLTSILPSEILEEIEYLPGAFSVEYGRATGGVINAETRAPRTDGYHGSIDMDVFDAGLFAEGPIVEGWSFFAAVRRSYIDVILPAVIPEDAGLNFSVAPRYWDYQVKVQWEPDLDNRANIFLFGSSDALEFLIAEPPADASVRGTVETTTAFHRLRLEWERDISSQVQNTLQVSAGIQDLTFLLGEDLRFILDSRPFSIRDRLDFQLSESLALRAGLDFDLAEFDLSIRAPAPPKEGEFPIVLGSSEVLTIERTNNWFVQPALWFEIEWDAFSGFTLVPGIRGDFYNEPVDGSIDARLAARYDLDDQWTIKAAVGTFHEPPQPDEASEEFGNPDLGLEWALHYVLGGEYQATEYFNIDLQFFYKDLFELVTRSNDLVERDGETVAEVYSNDGRGRVFGAELLVRHQLANNFFGWISYTLSRSERRDGTDEDFRLFSWDQTHILTLIGSYQLPKGWSIGARFRYVTGNPQTPLLGGIYDSDADAYIRIAGPARSERLEAFHQLDIRVDKIINFDSWDLNFYLDIQNVYNHGNPEGLNYNFDYSESQTITGLPIIPSLGVRGAF